MTLEQFEAYVDLPHIEWSEDEESFYFRDLRFNYYKDHPENATKVLKTLIGELSPEQLHKEVTQGLKVEQISRVTGYFAKVNSWNPGKRGELRDRHREI